MIIMDVPSSLVAPLCIKVQPVLASVVRAKGRETGREEDKG